MTYGTLDDLPESADVATRRPRVILLIAALLVAAFLVVVVVVFALGTVAHVIDVGSNSTPSLSAVEQGIGIDLPDDARVLAASSTDDAFSAEIALPEGDLPDFTTAGYGPATQPSAELATMLGDETALQYLAASSDTLSASAATVSRDGQTILFVDVRAIGR